MIWNKGLTKFTDERVAKYGRSLSKYYEKLILERNPILEKRICPKCGKEFEIDIRKSNRFFCSRNCANSHVLSDETKHKISEGLYRYNKSIGKTKIEKYYRDNIKKIPSYKHKKNCTICGSEKGTCPRPDVCKHHQILKSLIKFGFDMNTKGTLNVINEFDRLKSVIQEIYNSHPSDEELKNNWNYTSGLANFHKLIKSLGIKSRSSSDSQKEAYLLGKSNLPIDINSHYKQCWYKTWDNKYVYLRSSYEYDYAKYLDENKINYNVENLRIEYFDTQKCVNRIAIPDFYLIDTNEIIEIKSDWTLDIQNMKDKFKTYIKLGYKPKLILNHKEVDLFNL